MKRTPARPKPTKPGAWSVERVRKLLANAKPISLEEWNRQHLQQKQRLKYSEWTDVPALQFPGYFTLHLDYGATGEGETRGLTFCFAASGDQLRKIADEDFGPYFADGALIRTGLLPLPGYEWLVPRAVGKLVADIAAKSPDRPAGFHFTTSLHANYS